MNDQSNMPATRREPSPLAVLSKELEHRQEQYRMALPSHIKPEDLQRTVVMAAQQNPKLLEADRRTLMLSCMKAAQDGLLPDGREAALVPFSVRKKDPQGGWRSVTEVQYMPMVYGLRKKIMQSDEIASMQVGVVYMAEYESGRFLFEVGLEPPIRYKPDLTLPMEETTDEKIVAAWSLVKFKDGSWSGEVMRRAEIDKIQNLSQTGSKVDYKGNPREPKGPWADHFGEMAKKTVMRRHSKVLPMSGDIFRDVEGDDVERSIRSATGVLDSVDEAAPVALPSQDEPVDEETGEIVEQGQEREAADPATGMTEVDEETARKLDAGEDVDGQESDADDEPDAKTQWLEKIKSNIGETLTLQTLKNWDAEWQKGMASFDDDTVAEVEALFTAKRRELPE